VERSQASSLVLENANSMGTSFALRGCGDVTVLTPPEFSPGRHYVATYASATRQVQQRELVPGQDRRLQLQIDLDQAAYASGGLLGGNTAAYARVTIAPR
jgi:hypothetical protein